MKVIYNRLLPLPGFYAINLFGVVFAHRACGRMTDVDLNHEYIHTLQQRELLYLPFYLLYLAEWLYWLVRLGHPHRAYRRISFEQEAYTHQHDLTYARHRRHYACWRSS